MMVVLNFAVQSGSNSCGILDAAKKQLRFGIEAVRGIQLIVWIQFTDAKCWPSVSTQVSSFDLGRGGDASGVLHECALETFGESN